MSRIRMLAFAALSIGFAPVAAAAQGRAPRPTLSNERADAAKLRDLENQWARAVVRRDSATLSTLIAPQWVYSDESGVMQRDAGIKAFTSGADTVVAATNPEMRTILYPGTAVVIGILEMRGRGPAGPFVRRYRYTDTWMRIDGRWQCIASQDYLMPERRRGR